jgi:hypothetical protein
MKSSSLQEAAVHMFDQNDYIPPLRKTYPDKVLHSVGFNRSEHLGYETP